MTQSQLFAEEVEEQPLQNTDNRMAVLVPYPIDKAYSYIVPDGLSVEPGDYVIVPLGSREIPGVVWGGSDEDIPAKKLKTLPSH